MGHRKKKDIKTFEVEVFFCGVLESNEIYEAWFVEGGYCFFFWFLCFLEIEPERAEVTPER